MTVPTDLWAQAMGYGATPADATGTEPADDVLLGTPDSLDPAKVQTLAERFKDPAEMAKSMLHLRQTYNETANMLKEAQEQNRQLMAMMQQNTARGDARVPEAIAEDPREAEARRLKPLVDELMTEDQSITEEDAWRKVVAEDRRLRSRVEAETKPLKSMVEQMVLNTGVQTAVQQFLVQGGYQHTQPAEVMAYLSQMDAGQVMAATQNPQQLATLIQFVANSCEFSHQRNGAAPAVKLPAGTPPSSTPASGATGVAPAQVLQLAAQYKEMLGLDDKRATAAAKEALGVK